MSETKILSSMRRFLIDWLGSEAGLNDILKANFDAWVGVWDHNLFKFSLASWHKARRHFVLLGQDTAKPHSP
jgi:hypothetical protein